MAKKMVVLDLDKSSIHETAKAFSVATMNGRTGQEIGRAWFPKSQCKIYHPETNACPNRMEVLIPLWLAKNNVSQVEMLEGFDCIK